MPTVASRVTPACRARATSSAVASLQESRWQWVSTIRPLGGLGLGLDLGEELAEVADRRAAADVRRSPAVSSERSSRPSAASSFSADSGTHGCSSTDTTRSPSASA